MVRAGLERALTAAWFGRSVAPAWLLPLSWLYDALRRLAALPWALGWRRPWRAPVPVIVVGNLVAGGAGKTPTVIALTDALRAHGRRPGVVSRGHGRRSHGVIVADATITAAELGDEPWLIHRRTALPLAVGVKRAEAAAALLHRHPEVDVLIADDGLQHAALARDLEVWVFDERGVGNGALLPAGPLRQPMPRVLPSQARVLYNAPAPSTPLPGWLATRSLSGAVRLADWHRDQPMDPAALTALRGRQILAVAAIAAPQRFFDMLSDAGLQVRPWPLPDHAPLSVSSWPTGTRELVCTEKDAAKLDPRSVGDTAVWVVGLDFRLPSELLDDLMARLPRRD